MKKEPSIFEADAGVDSLCTVRRALLYDKSPTSPTATLRGQIKQILKIMECCKLFTWYERPGVFFND